MSPVVYLNVLHLPIICLWTLEGNLGGNYSHIHIHNHDSVHFVAMHSECNLYKRSDYTKGLLKGQCQFLNDYFYIEPALCLLPDVSRRSSNT